MTRLRAPDPSLSPSGGANNSTPAPPTSEEPRWQPYRVHTTALYRGLPVTVIGRVDAPLIAIAAYATPLERALGVITIEDDGSRTLYRVADRGTAVATLDEAALLLAARREANDRGESS